MNSSENSFENPFGNPFGNPFATLTDLASGLASQSFSSVELTRFYLDRIARLDRSFNCFITVTADLALEQAARADTRRRSATATALTGLPIAYKDIYCTAGVRTSCGSRMLDNFIAPYDATVVARFAAAGAVMLGKTNMDEFAMGSSCETSFYGPTRNPWDSGRVPGGSSGGSAAAVAAGLTPAATGTDTGGSIRQPAALSGICGLKPTYGSVSRYGMVAFASSLDQGGPMARSVADLALLYDVMAGFDPNDSTSISMPDATKADDGDARLTIGLPREYFAALTDPDFANVYETARRVLEELGHRCVDVSLPHTAAAVPTYYVVACAEASTNLARYDGVRYGYRCEDPKDLTDLYERSRSEGFGEEVKRRILTGTYALSIGYYDAYYLKAQRVRRLIRDDFTAAFVHVDALLTPTAPGTAFPIGHINDPVQMYQQDVFTVPASLAGIPALALPCGFLHGLPIGMQLMGPHFHDRRLLRLGAAYQRETDWHRRTPTLPE
jgi:aspartyl-tRNA(Asn)/glutamyl-tRNA(Gln) amidotransferase subunit A